MHRKINPVIATIIVAATATFVGTTIWILTHKSPPANEIASKVKNRQGDATIDGRVMLPPKTEFIVEGTEIYQKIGQSKQLLFINVENVSEVRRGPDGKTIHFKLKKNNFDQAHCANLASNVTPAEPGYGDPPPSKAPWDYKRIAHYATLEGCGALYRAGGFLYNTSYFAYIKIGSPGTVSLFLIDTLTNDEKIIPMDSQIWKQTEGSGDDNTGFQGDNDSTYYYPQDHASVSDGKILLAVGRLLVAIDPIKNKLMGTELLIEPTYRIIGDSFGLYSNINSPLVVLRSGWGGGSMLDAILDLSTNNLRVIDLHKYPQPGINGFETPFFEWKERNLLLHFYTQKDITDQISKADLDYFSDMNRSYEDLSQKENEIKEKLMSTKKYVEVWCSLVPGMFEGACYALTPGNEYQIMPGKELIRLK